MFAGGKTTAGGLAPDVHGKGKVVDMHQDGSLGFTETAAASGDGPSSAAQTWVVFLVDEQRYALEISEVERIVRAVEVKPLPQSPPHVLGIINMQSRILPVINLRHCLSRPERDIRLEDHFVVVHLSEISAVLPVDAALGSLEVFDTSALPDEKTRDRCLKKIIPHHEGVIYILDLEYIVLGDQSTATSDVTSLMRELEKV